MLRLLAISICFILVRGQTTLAPPTPPAWVNNLADFLTINGLREDLPIGTYLGTLMFIVPPGNPQATYSTTSTVFSVDPISGNVTLKSALSYQNAPTFVVDFFATIPGTSYTNETMVTVNVLSVNHPPTFDEPSYSTLIREDAKVGSLVYNFIFVSDQDSGPNGTVSVSCIGLNTACQTFSVDIASTNGFVHRLNVTLISPLNYAVTPQYNMVIQAMDGGTPSLSATATLTITVENVAASAPVFLNTPITFSITELAPNTTNLTTIQAESRSNPPTALSISIQSDPMNFFYLGPTTSSNGGIYSAQLYSTGRISSSLLPNQASTYTITVQAVEVVNGAPTQVSTITAITVSIININNYPPTFQYLNYAANVTEGMPLGATVPALTMICTDPDVGTNAFFALSAMSSSAVTNTLPTDTFGIVPTYGQGSVAASLIVNRPDQLVYEDPTRQKWIVVITARENETAQHFSGTATVTLTVLNPNNQPTPFLQSVFAVSITDQPGQNVILNVAIPIQQQITYAITAGNTGNLFAMNPTQGLISIAAPLNAAVTPSVTLTISATNQYGLISYATVIITIHSASSVGPQFQQEPYVTTVDENSTVMNPSLFIYATPLQHDKVIRYYFVGTNYNLFSLVTSPINPPDYTMTMSHGVDYNDTPNRQGYYLLTIQAADDTVDPNLTNTTVIVNIKDENNHAPVFGSPTYTATVSEITPPGTSVIQLNATDLDVGPNALINYIIQFGSKDNFVVDYNSGLITVAFNSDLNIEKNGNLYSMTLLAVDNGSPPLTGTAMVYVHVTPSVYQQPVFSQSNYEFTVLDSRPLGFNVGAVSATDPDVNGKFVYILNSTTATALDASGNLMNMTNATYNYMNSFTINSTTGVISIAQQLNRNYAAVISFLVQANVTNPDQPIPISSVMVTIYIVSTSTTPQGTISFYKPSLVNNVFNESFLEKQVPGTVVAQFGAVYVTNTRQVITSYTLAPFSDPNGYLVLNSTTGVLSVNKDISYDALNGSTVLTYGVVAHAPSPNTVSATATINVQIISLNQNVPVFTSALYNFSVYENASIGYVVGQVHADLKIAGSITYTLTGTSATDFSMNPTSGVITVANGLSAQRQQIYILTATTIDASGLGILQPSSAAVYIYVIPLNNKLPSFQNLPYDVSVLDSTPTNTTIIQVVAYDQNLNHLPVTYAIVGGNSQGIFTIDPNTGVIKPATSLSGHTSPTPYVLNVSATVVYPQNTLINYATVSIVIANLTQLGGPPGFYSPYDQQIFNVYQGYPNVLVTIVRAYSNRPQYPNVTYGLYDIPQNVADNSHFQLNTYNGTLQSVGALNMTQQRQYTLQIQAADSGTPPLISRITIYVDVYSDQPPAFTSCPGNFSYPIVYASVLERQPVGQAVTTVTACSNDYNNPQIYYYITAGNTFYLNITNSTPPFAINTKTGQIYTTNILQWLQTPVININVTASLNSTPPLPGAPLPPGSVVTVSINVNGIDFYGPTFDQNPGQPSFCSGIGITASAGILDYTGYNYQVIHYYAGVCNSPQYRAVTFTVSTIQFITPSTGVVVSVPGAFAIDAVTGWVVTQFTSYMQYYKGYFTMLITATDSQGRSAQSTLTVYIISDSERLRYVFGNGPKVVAPYAAPFVQNINNVLQSQPMYTSTPSNTPNITADILRTHVTSSTSLDFSESDLCFHVIQNQQVLTIAQVETIFNSIPTNMTLPIYNQYNVQPVSNTGPNQYLQPCNVHITTRWWSGYWFLWWLLIALALFIWVIALILIICVCVYWPISRRNFFQNRPYVVLDDPPMAPASDFEWQQTIHRVD